MRKRKREVSRGNGRRRAEGRTGSGGAGGGEEALWAETREVRTPADGFTAPSERLRIELPVEEGVYDIVMTLSEKRLVDRIVPANVLMHHQNFTS